MKQFALQRSDNFNQMSTIEPRTTVKSRLPGFRSTYQLPHPQRLKTPTPKKMHHNFSSFISPHDKYSHDSEAQLGSNKSLLDTNLPQIQSKRSTQKRSSMLQMWLDEALDPQQKQKELQNPQLRIDVDKTGPLKTVQKFNIDKKFLKSLNLSIQSIEKIYNSLYIYTHGINNTFGEIMALTRANEHLDKKVIDHFWKAFIKLLEGCTSFRTTFQVVEESHLKTIAELRHSFCLREQQWLDQKKGLDSEIIKLMKKINDQSSIIGKLTTDYNISEATLYLTDQAFNDQVNTRLKFEQKVNEMFGSYEELRSKYTNLLEQFRSKEYQLKQSQRQKAKLQQEALHMEIQVQQFRKQTKRAKQAIEQREKQLLVKRQQIFELIEEKKILSEEKDHNEEEVRKIINKMHNYRQSSDELRTELETKGILEKELNKRIREQQDQLSFCRQTEERLYSQLQEQIQLIADLEKNKIQNKLKIGVISEKCAKAEEELAHFKIILQDQKISIAKLQKQLEIAKGQIVIKTNSIEKNNKLLAELQSINSKSGILLNNLTSQKRKLQAEINEVISIRERFQQEMTGMKMLLENRDVELAEVKSKLDNERQVFKAKIASLKEEIQFRQKKVIEFHSQMQQGQNSVIQAEKLKTETANTNSQLKRTIFNLSAEITEKSIKIVALQKERSEQAIAYQQLEYKLEQVQNQIVRYEEDLKLKLGIINSADHLSGAEAQCLRQLLESYRESRERRVCYVHPMLFEDAVQQIARLKDAKIQLVQANCQLSAENKQLRQYLETKNQQYDEMSQKYSIIKPRLTKCEEQLKQAREKILALEKDITDKDDANRNYLEHSNHEIKEMERTIQALQKQNRLLNQENTKNAHTASLQTAKVYKAEEQCQHLSRRNRQLEGQLKLAEQTIQTLEGQREQIERKIQSHQLVRHKQPDNIQLKQSKQVVFQKPKPTVSHQQCQTEKKFSHASKFEIPKGGHDIGCQVEELRENDEHLKPRIKNPQKQQQPRKVDAGQFKRALKATYMRR